MSKKGIIMAKKKGRYSKKVSKVLKSFGKDLMKSPAAKASRTPVRRIR